MASPNRSRKSITLLPAVCRDCGRSGRGVELGAYLDFQMCASCIALREKALRVDKAEAPTSRPGGRQPRRPTRR